MVTNTWPVRRKKPEWDSPNRTIASPAIANAAGSGAKSQIPCLRKRLQGGCASFASVGFTAPVCVLPWTWRSRNEVPFIISIRCIRWSTAGICCFIPAGSMDQIFQALIDRTRAPLDLDRIKTIFGDKNRPHYDKRKSNPTRWGVVVETPAYDLTVFKVHYGKMTLKIYTKGERVLRIEVIRAQYQGISLGSVAALLCRDRARLQAILERFLNAVGCIGLLLCRRRHAGKLPQPTTSRPNEGGRNRSQSTPNAPCRRSRSGAVHVACGFTASDLAAEGPRHERPSPESAVWTATRRL